METLKTRDNAWQKTKNEIEIKRPESFYGNTEKDQGNTTLITAQLLKQSGIEVDISDDAVDYIGKPLKDYVAINANPEGKELLKAIWGTTELTALRHAKVNPEKTPPPVDNCQWDNDTKGRVNALHWGRQLAILQRHSNVIPNSSERINEAMFQKNESLGSLDPLSIQDIRELIAVVVGREIALRDKSQEQTS